MNTIRRVAAGAAIAAMTMVPLAGMASAGNKGGGAFCPGRDNTCGGGGGGGGGTGNGPGKKADQCDYQSDGFIVVNGITYQCNDGDVVSIKIL